MDLNKTLEQQWAELNEQYNHTVFVLPQRQAVQSKDEFMLVQAKIETFQVSVKWLHFQVWLPSMENEFLPIRIILTLF